MKTPRCTKCKWFRRSKAKVRIYDHGNGISMSANSPIPDAIIKEYNELTNNLEIEDYE